MQGLTLNCFRLLLPALLLSLQGCTESEKNAPALAASYAEGSEGANVPASRVYDASTDASPTGTAVENHYKGLTIEELEDFILLLNDFHSALREFENENFTNLNRMEEEVISMATTWETRVKHHLYELRSMLLVREYVTDADKRSAVDDLVAKKMHAVVGDVSLARYFIGKSLDWIERRSFILLLDSGIVELNRIHTRLVLVMDS